MTRLGPDHYILLCAEMYAATLIDYRKVDDDDKRQILKSKMNYLLESGKLEVEAEQRRRENRLGSDIRSFVRDRKPLSRTISNTEAEAIRHFYAIPPAALL